MAQHATVSKNNAGVPARGKISVCTGFKSRMDLYSHANLVRQEVASYPSLHDGIMRGKISRPRKGHICAAQILAYPDSYGSFREGQTIFDEEARTALPWEYIKQYPVAGEKKSLVITARDFEKWQHGGISWIVPIPSEIIVIGEGSPINGPNIPQEKTALFNAGIGIPHTETKVPIEVSYGKWRSHPKKQQLLFVRNPYASIRVLSRTLERTQAPSREDVERHVFATLPIYGPCAVLLEDIPQEPGRKGPAGEA